MTQDLAGWTPRARPARIIMQGRHVRLEPLTLHDHESALFAASTVPDADRRFTWLPDRPPADADAFRAWLITAAASDDPLFYAVIDRRTDTAVGRQALMRIDTANGVIEIGNIYWGPAIARTRAATEALFLAASYVFDDLGYRRFEWKCNDDNAPSKRAALRFGFRHEGTFRQHMVVKGLNRDTAWFAMTDDDWPAIRTALSAWLDPANFGPDGAQIRRLEDFRQA